MGYPPRLNGKSPSLPPDGSAVCPNCGRPLRTFGILGITLSCPYCKHQFKHKDPSTSAFSYDEDQPSLVRKILNLFKPKDPD